MHKGAAAVFSDFKANGYKIIYLTARPISMINWTRKSISELEDEDGKTLPNWAVITSTLGRNRTFERHAKQIPHSAFKAPWLQQFRELFPGNPFDAGFGNQDTDVESYRKVGIPDVNIFHILKNGSVVSYENGEKSTWFASFKALARIVNMFKVVPRAAQRVHQHSDTDSNGAVDQRSHDPSAYSTPTSHKTNLKLSPTSNDIEESLKY